jgi:NAD(P)-dependent dehydrogenase (short-subunit alcohol dehydrogenase family)
MAELHAFQIREVVAMSSPIVLLTGVLKGIGRAAARVFANEGERVVILGGRKKSKHF